MAHPTLFPRSRERRDKRDEISAFLLDHRAPAAPAILRAAGLAAYAYPALPPDDPRRDALRPDYLRSLRRHDQLRRELASLIRAWADAGIEALLFKGFHLAEFVYPSPGMRFHGDVDLLVRPARADSAVAIATASGWTEGFRGRPGGHEVGALFRSPGTEVDLHRYALHRRTLRGGPTRRITNALWERSERIEWEGTTVRLPAPVDALLVGLVLQRSWSGEVFLKPHDATDARLLLERVSAAELAARARELGCERTLAHFLDRCDPDRGRLDFTRTRAERWRLQWIVGRERGFLTLRYPKIRRLLRGPGLLFDVARVLPEVLRARRLIRREKDLRELFRRVTPPAPGRRIPPRQRHRTVRAIRWATRLLGLNRDGDCLLRSVAIYTALRRRGWPVTFVSGVRRDAARVDGHAWVEWHGDVLPGLGEPSIGLIYRETFRWPRGPRR